MKLIKLALISFFLLFLVILVISLFIPSDLRISRAKDISVYRDTAIQYMGNPATWKQWFPGMEKQALLFIGGQPKGLVLDEGRKRFLVIDTVAANAVRAEYKGLSKTVTTGWLVQNDKGEKQLTIQWYMDFKLKWYPWEKFASLLFEKNYGAMMEQGLEKLKTELEAR
jgi:Polyketide cyclase / dehydrase and lipid transport